MEPGKGVAEVADEGHAVRVLRKDERRRGAEKGAVPLI